MKDKLIKEQNKPPRVEYAKCEDCKKDSLDSLIKANQLKAMSTPRNDVWFIYLCYLHNNTFSNKE